MQDKYPDRFVERIFCKHYRAKWSYWEEEIRQVMWTSLFESYRRYKRYKSIYHFEEYAEKVIVKNVGYWIKENGYYRYWYLPLDRPFRDSDETMLSTYLTCDDIFCPLELYDFISRLSFIKFIICKGYILKYRDEEITKRLNITNERLEEIKIELQQDFKQGYLI